MGKKLSKANWLDFSLKELAVNGHKGLTANSLSSKLGVSRGSFYWHFREVREFEVMLLQRWSEVATDMIIEDLEPIKNPKQRLSILTKRAMNSDMKLDRAVRSWAISNKLVAQNVREVDARRIAYIEQLLKSMKVPSGEVGTRAKMLYWASIGRMMLSEYEEGLVISDSQLKKFTLLISS